VEVDVGGYHAVRVDRDVDEIANPEVRSVALTDNVQHTDLGRGSRAGRGVELDPESAGQLIGSPGGRDRRDALCVAFDDHVKSAGRRQRLAGHDLEYTGRDRERLIPADNGVAADVFSRDCRATSGCCRRRDADTKTEGEYGGYQAGRAS